MKSHVASRQPGLCHEAYGNMLADCFAFQTDIVAGDANMSGYRYGGSRQVSSSIEHSCWQDMVRYFVRAHNDGMQQDPYCRVIPRFVSSKPTIISTMVGRHVRCRVRPVPSCKLGHCPDPGLHRLLYP